MIVVLSTVGFAAVVAGLFTLAALWLDDPSAREEMLRGYDQ